MINNKLTLGLTLIISCLLAACTSSTGLKKERSSSSPSLFNKETIFEVFQNGVFTAQDLDKEPMPNGGDKTFLMTMYRKMNYPPQARNKGIQGKVLVTVVVNEFGQAESIELKKGIGFGCDEEALAAVQRGCKLGFEPAKKNNTPIKVRFDIPVKFSLV